MLVEGTVACRNVGLWKIVGKGVLPTTTVDSVTKLLPITLSVTGPLPASAEDGDVDAICGVGLCEGFTVNVIGSVVPPPGEGVVTVMVTVPGF